ncbi:radical SAM protein [Candidatus Pelagibacter sp. HIMB1321]|uniref:radical SAM protein n=1 Tax=Candidatus Pelagibacter sp. HIMB1321 TaxID=1388755 RepID=UPI000A080D7B|nr:radical SAM protein [Candidatus Pelagibacter sp. HIMB1321]SMF73003.1 4Fe-4S single cluster domain-containing protein [Candidatus Pelagibacter sp. HIMB1321]
MNNLINNKFKDPKVTADGSDRAFVEAEKIKTLWFNTGTLCNIECKNCYIESSPKNDRLVYLTFDEVKNFIDEAIEKNLGTEKIGFTGGEPFMNKDIIRMIEYSLSKGLKTLVLSNAMKPMLNRVEEIKKVNHKNLTIRVSIDHYEKSKHEEIRGNNTYDIMMKGLKWLDENNFNYALATRLLWNETEEELRKNFGIFLKNNHLKLNTNSKQELVTFAEMDESVDTPEITTSCWDILKKNPKDIMCSSSRMIVRKKGLKKLSVIACTLLPYDEEFDLGQTLTNSLQKIYLNHKHCSKFCVLGGSSCS